VKLLPKNAILTTPNQPIREQKMENE